VAPPRRPGLFAVGLLNRSVGANWFEAVGTRVGARVTLIAVTAAAIVFVSEGVARRREERRRHVADAAAEGCSASTGRRRLIRPGAPPGVAGDRGASRTLGNVFSGPLRPSRHQATQGPQVPTRLSSAVVGDL
jgi:hypothetical protein